MMTRLEEKEHYFRDFAVWPSYAKFNTTDWLNNFLPQEKSTAIRLLSTFSFFNEPMTDALFRGALQNYLSSTNKDICFPQPPQTTDLSTVAFIACEGEDPHPTDSGHYFSRKLRDLFDIPQPNIFVPGEALKINHQVKHLIFFDDFAGSGNQFLETINRTHDLGGYHLSHADLVEAGKHTIAYCPCICTEQAKLNISQQFPSIKISPSHTLGPEANVTLPQSRIWSDITKDDAEKEIQHIKNSSKRAGYEEEDGSLEDWRGFHGLGLNIAFSHGIPDASLPIFFSTRGNWVPLIKSAK